MSEKITQEEFHTTDFKKLSYRSEYAFNTNEILTFLKIALTTRDFLITDNIVVKFQNDREFIDLNEKLILLQIKKDIISANSPEELKKVLTLFFQVDSIYIYVLNLWSLMEDGIYRVGKILEDYFGDDFQLGASELGCDIFFGNYAKTHVGVHKDAANLSFTYSYKEMLLCQYDLFAKEAEQIAGKENYPPPKYSRGFNLPYSDSGPDSEILKKAKRVGKHVKLDSGDTFFWSANTWHTGIGSIEKTAMTFNIALFQSDETHTKATLTSALNQIERENEELTGTTTYTLNELNSIQNKQTLVQEEYELLQKKINLIKTIYLNKREEALSKFLSSCGICSQAIKDHKQNFPILKKVELENIILLRPQFYKIHYVAKEGILDCYFFGERVRLIDSLKTKETIAKINQSSEIKWSNFADEAPPQILKKLFHLLLKSPGVIIC